MSDSFGRVPAARGRAVALRVEPLSKARRLAPDGLPSLTQHGQAGCAGGMTTAARSRARGSRALIHSRVRERGPLDELAGVPFAALRSVRCTPARSSPRSPATPDAGPLRPIVPVVMPLTSTDQWPGSATKPSLSTPERCPAESPWPRSRTPPYRRRELRSRAVAVGPLRSAGAGRVARGRA